MSETPDTLPVDSSTDELEPAAVVPDASANADADADLTDGVVTDADGTDAEATDSDAPAPRSSRLVAEGDIAADYLEGLLDIADLDGDIDMDVEADRALVSIVGGDLRHLVGRNGEVLDALQELTRLAVLRETGDRSRLMLDVDGFRAQRRVELTATGAEAATKATESGESVSLPPMTPFERKIVHDAVAAAGLVSESEGVEPMRYVVVRPA